MKRFIPCFILVIFVFLSCNSSKTGKTVITYTNADATLAIDAFHETFFDKSKGIYAGKSDKRGVAAIWTQAIYWDMAVNAYKRTKSTKHKQMVDDIYAGNKSHYATFDWDNGKVWFIYDDIMWWIISLARGYEEFGNKEYLDYAESGFKRVWEGSPVVKDPGSYDPKNGGMFWRWIENDPSRRSANDGKMACINYPTVIAAMALYNATEKGDYLNKAKEIYKWSSANLFDQETGLVADSKHGNSTPHWKAQLYNQGTCIGAAMMLYKETGEQRYLDDAVLAADYVKNTMCTAEGMLPFKTGVEQGIYGAIFAQYIILLIEDGNKPEYADWMQANIDAAWSRRDVVRNITYKDVSVFCPTGAVEVYDASTCPALMQVIRPVR
ncbi:putative alpha-1,6-mannanase (GH76 family) [Dysgonomonas hofstadii]|uniref:Putative alpha-1,6-mannanase (GH76 family) n=1 Tax=Dysgonomonas hofstadii TaxID=637886 RepID=A0A840CUR1_9BACT|nr:glycoside hydrolase family 76 protein [Dysgonomonas hofstadii]MBB4035493.1 putative alpha-1,6-mannanase (GH76 family) [Dysgonomonas hofstadii]